MIKYLFCAGLVKKSASNHQENEKLIKRVISWSNMIFGQSIEDKLSLTEEQIIEGIILSPNAAVELILNMEEYIIEEEMNLKLRYVVKEVKFYEGAISSEDSIAIFQEKLTAARTQINEPKKEDDRFNLTFGANSKVNKLMRITQHFIDHWKPKDRSTVAGFLQGHDYKSLARLQGKDESSLWRRRKSLAIDDYLLCKELLQELIS